MYTIMQTLTAGAFSVAGRKTRADSDKLLLHELIRDNFKVVNTRLEHISDDVAENTKKTEDGFKKFNGRISRIEDQVFPQVPIKISELPKPWRDPVIIKWALIIIALLVAGWFGIDVSGVLEK